MTTGNIGWHTISEKFRLADATPFFNDDENKQKNPVLLFKVKCNIILWCVTLLYIYSHWHFCLSIWDIPPFRNANLHITSCLFIVMQLLANRERKTMIISEKDHQHRHLRLHIQSWIERQHASECSLQYTRPVQSNCRSVFNLFT